MNRRRALMMSGGSKIAPIYRLKNQTVSNSEVNTGVAPFKADTPCTILLDINLNNNPASGTASLCKIMYNWFSALNTKGFCIGKVSRTTGQQNYWWIASGNGTAVAEWKTGTGRYRYAVTHGANSDTITISCKKDDGSINTRTNTQTFTPSTDALTLGRASSSQELPENTVINLAEIYDAVLPQSDIDAFFA